MMRFLYFTVVLVWSGTVMATDSQYFFQARKGQFFLTPLFFASHEDYAVGAASTITAESTRRDYGMNFHAEYGLSETLSVEGGIGGAYNTYRGVILGKTPKVSYAGPNAVVLRIKGRAELPTLSFRYGLDARIAIDSEPERALWDWGTTVSPFIGIQIPYDNGVVGIQLMIDAFRSSRRFVSGFTDRGSDIQINSSSVTGGQRIRGVIFAEGDDRKYDVGLGVGLEHHLETTFEGGRIRSFENNIFIRGYVVYEFLPKVNLVFDAHGTVGNREALPIEEIRRNQFVVMAGVRMEL